MICPMCQKEFEQKYHGQKCCSPKCFDDMNRQGITRTDIKRNEEQQKSKTKLLFRKCAICGKVFRLTQPNQKYCCSTCAKQAHCESARKSAKNHRALKAKPLPEKLTCPICKRIFVPKSIGQKYCDEGCADEATRRNIREHNRRRNAQNRAKEATTHAVDQVTHTITRTRTFADWQREAAECNMDYGNYRAQIEHFGKTYEQLKATADRRQFQFHSHVSTKGNRHD